MSENDFSKRLDSLKPKDKEPRSRSVLESWIAKAEQEIDPARSGRLTWLISTTICSAKLQSVLDAQGKSRFALKGGTLMQHRLGLAARATKDLDGMIRGDIDDFLDAFDSSLGEDWGPISFQRSEVEIIRTPAKAVKPRRFDLHLVIRGQTWRKVQIEISPSEGRAGESFDLLPAPNLDAFGIPTPDHLVGLALSYQIAQKVHGATDPHDPPMFVNRRARDVVDLLLLKELAESAGDPGSDEIRAAIVDVFESRAEEAKLLGRSVRTLPAKVVAYPHWGADYAEAANGASVEMPMEEAIGKINGWLRELGVGED
ncbi:nucleotidyl transferase AbiEii/AbiGii toxin family protein [Adlercreutzia sp. ZJ154]|uniref:nucleotidyl transferase AbiEii/AbiGii toxin family protein n=1 Tax=Adlercreutzia sp. ZJ154 TaxID=2709790 RepID=UPI0013ED4AC6|nr:nucleotidyl transferase AbiEii/AbiGii toxin family protein [Adlercreutzia sp. ZJ154]